MDGDSIRGKSLLLECEGYRVETETIDVREVDKFLRHFDPDVILSDEGDASLLPFSFLERQDGKSLSLESGASSCGRQVHPKGFSYFSYGRTYYRAPAHLFLGRWHIDRRTLSSTENREWTE